MKFSRVKTDIRCIGSTNLLVGGLLFLFIALLVRLACNAPYVLYKAIGISSFAPPIWVMVIAWSAFFFLGGAAFFGALSCRGGDIYKYKGGMFFVIMISLALAWYPIFFDLKLFWLALIIALICTVCAFLTSSCYFKLSSFLGSIMALLGFWLAYSVILNALCIFSTR